MSKCISTRLNDATKPTKITKCGNGTKKQANWLFSSLFHEVSTVINRSNVGTDVKIRIWSKYTEFLGEHVQIVMTIVKPESGKSFEVAKSDVNNFQYDIKIRVRNDIKK